MSPIFSFGVIAALGGALGTTLSMKDRLSQGMTPWDDPVDWLVADAKSLGMSAASGLAGNAIGPALGAAGEGLGIGVGTGTIAADAGAATPQTIAGVVPKTASNVIADIGTRQPMDIAKNIIGNTVGSSVTGALKDPNDPLRGAAMGAASGVATGVFNAGASAAFRGMDNGFWSPRPGLEIAPDPPAAAQMSMMHPSYATEFRMQPTPPQFGGRMLGAAAGMGGNMAGSAARMSVGSAMTPPPPSPPQNPYQSFGVTPYWAKQGYR